MYKKKSHSLIILIPSYNELENLKKFLLKLKKKFQILVIDDNSSDKTHNWLKFNKINFIRNTNNLGYEKSLIKGIKIILKKNKYNSILTMDADGQHTIESLKKFLVKKNFSHDIVVGKRSSTNRYIEDIISFIFFKNNKIKDPLCGLKLYKCKILKKINFNNIKTYFFVDLLFNCMLITNKVINIDIKILPRYGVPRIGNFFKVNLKLLNILIYCLFKRL
jgi:GT2 family glycosyltransferase